jgi:hypothetical protein
VAGAETTQDNRGATVWRVLFAVLGIGVLLFAIALIFFWESTSTVLEATPVAGQPGLTDTKRTTTTSPVSGELSTSVLGFTLVLLLVAAYFNRITKITFPGGSAELSNSQKAESAQIVGQKAKESEPEITRLATQEHAAPQSEADAAAAQLAVKSATVTSTVQDSARQLLALAQVDPEQCRALATRLEVPAEVIESSVILKRTTPELWEALADHALKSF